AWFRRRRSSSCIAASRPAGSRGSYADCILTGMADHLLTALMRWLHISSVITLIGGIVYWRFVMDPSTKKISPEAYKELEESAAAHFRPIVYTVMGTLVASGL